MPLIFQQRITPDDLTKHPENIFMFGDNELRRGKGGQAGVCRGHPNALGVATKRAPERTDDAYWTDTDFDRIITIIALKRLGEPASTRRIPRVLNMHDLTGDLPPNAHYCGRPSPLRNRSVIGRDGTRDEVCDQYEACLPTQPQLMARVRVLLGYDLVCWCSPRRCHCDFLLRLANPHLFECA